MTNKKIDAEEELLNILSQELSNTINGQVILDMMESMRIIEEFNLKLKEIKAINRQIQIDNLLDDTYNELLKIEDTEEFKKLSDENKAEYIKNGKL